MRAVALPVFTAFLLGGCGLNVRGIDVVRVTEPHSGYYAELHATNPDGQRVIVKDIQTKSLVGQPSGIGGEVPEPIWLKPGWYEVAYACPNTPDSQSTARIGLSLNREYYLECDGSNRLIVRLRQ